MRSDGFFLCSRRVALTTLLALTPLVLSAAAAGAANVKLKGATSSTSGQAKLKIDDFGTCYSALRLNVVFSESKRKAIATDQFGRKFKGAYEQSGTDGRKIEFKLDDNSRSRMRKAMEAEVKKCTGARNASADIDKLVLTGKINKSRDSLKLKGRVEGDGKADGEEGEAVYSFKTVGRLLLSGE